MNNLFQSIYDSVVVETNRPDRREEISQSIQTASRHLHSQFFFHKDIKSVVLSSSEDISHQFTLSPDKLIRKIHSVCPIGKFNKLGVPYQQVEAFENIMGHNWFSFIGNRLRIESSAILRSFQLNYYSFPSFNPLDYDSWIGNEYPHMVTDLASAYVFAKMNDPRAAGYFNLVGNSRAAGSHIKTLISDQGNLF